MEIKYECWSNFSCEIFPGFYDSIFDIYEEIQNYYNDNCDEEIEEGKEYGITDENYKKCELDIMKDWVDNMNSQLPTDDGINMHLDTTSLEMWSPREYNFSTDKLVVDVTFDIDKLIEWALITEKEDFTRYLKENWKSRDGFMSMVEWRFEDFKDIIISDYQKQQYSSNEMEVLIEYYLLNCIDFELVEEETYDKFFDILAKYVEVMDKNGN